MSTIRVSGLTFAYEGSYDNIFEDVSFTADTDWKLGFTGRNGRGKTTFLKLLLGEYEYRGSISASVEFDYFPFEIRDGEQERTIPRGSEADAEFGRTTGSGAELCRAVTGLEAAEQICPDFEQWELLREMSLLQLEQDVLWRPYRTLSSGERTKLQLSALFLRRNAFLLIDEPTNHLDAEGRRILGSYLRAKQGFILVSHDRSLLDECCDHILSINRTNIEIQKGNFSSWFANKKLQDSFERAENEKLKRDVARLSKAAAQTSDWSDSLEATKIGIHSADRGAIGAKSAKMMKRSKSIERRREDAVDEKSKLLKNVETPRELAISPVPYRSERLLELREFAAVYGEKVCGRVSFEVMRGDRIALSGKNGCGKSSVLRAAAGQTIEHLGTLWRGSGLNVSFVPQSTEGLSGPLSQYAAANGIDEPLFKAILRKLDFSRIQFEKDLADFSGGQKKKVLLARSLCERANLYVWDEPLNFIDVFSRMQIEALLKEYAPTLLFVEHDRTFAESIATKIVAFDESAK